MCLWDGECGAGGSRTLARHNMFYEKREETTRHHNAHNINLDTVVENCSGRLACGPRSSAGDGDLHKHVVTPARAERRWKSSHGAGVREATVLLHNCIPCGAAM